MKPIRIVENIEWVLKKYAAKILLALPGIFCLYLYNMFSSFLDDKNKGQLLEISAWLLVGLLWSLLLLAFYFIQFKATKRNLLKENPKFYEQIEKKYWFKKSFKKTMEKQKPY